MMGESESRDPTRQRVANVSLDDNFDFSLTGPKLDD